MGAAKLKHTSTEERRQLAHVTGIENTDDGMAFVADESYYLAADIRHDQAWTIDAGYLMWEHWEAVGVHTAKVTKVT